MSVMSESSSSQLHSNRVSLVGTNYPYHTSVIRKYKLLRTTLPPASTRLGQHFSSLLSLQSISQATLDCNHSAHCAPEKLELIEFSTTPSKMTVGVTCTPTSLFILTKTCQSKNVSTFLFTSSYSSESFLRFILILSHRFSNSIRPRAPAKHKRK